MSPAKKPPRPVTAWFLVWGDGKLASPATNKRRAGYVRCRVTPIRPGTDVEIERLAKALAKASGLHEMDQARFVLVFNNVARAAWKRGAR